MKKQLILSQTLLCFLIGLFTACQDELLEPGSAFPPTQIEEGIPGELTLSLSSNEFNKEFVMTRGNVDIPNEQHIHSAYIFVVNVAKEKEGADKCPVISRKYFTDLTPNLEVVKEGEKTYYVNKLTMPALSCNEARVFAIINVGFSEVQGIENDSELLNLCDTISTLKTLHEIHATLMSKKDEGRTIPEVNVERMQGHHLMSGYLSCTEHHHFDKGEQTRLQLKAENRKIVLFSYDEFGRLNPLRPLGDTTSGKTAAAIFAHRLDAKITVNILPDGDFKDTPGAYFRLTSWRVINTPIHEYIYWGDHQKRSLDNQYGNSKVFKRDLTETGDGGWTFTFFQFENFFKSIENKYLYPGNSPIINDVTVKKQYEDEYQVKLGDWDVAGELYDENGNIVYPNKFTQFGYSLRELENKEIISNGPEKVPASGDKYEPNAPGNNDQNNVVKNIGFKYAPKNASYVLITGEYFNPNEPVRRRKDSDKYLDTYPLDEYPYLNTKQEPVKTKEEAAKRTRNATVVYRVHLGYVGGANYKLNSYDTSQGIGDWSDYQMKLNDYNVLRNHHYTYTLKVAGVENIKLEATRENGGNILEQEKQPGAEGLVAESQHFFELDSHYEARNFTIDFNRMPEDYDEGFSFGFITPFDEFRGTLVKKAGGGAEIVDLEGKPLTTIRGRDMDWIHFAWHGNQNDPSRSLIDEKGNGISYSETYGCYRNQQSYLTKYSKLTQEEDSQHKYRLLNALDFTRLVWECFQLWTKAKEEGKPYDWHTLTFTMYVDEYYYDFNPVKNSSVDWTAFCNQPKRRALFFMEKEETSADQNSWYSDAHLAVYQNAIQTTYATSTEGGQTVANVAFGIEALDEFRAKYRTEGVKGSSDNQQLDLYQTNHLFKQRNSKNNGLYNIMQWFKEDGNNVIDWKTANQYYCENDRKKPLEPSDYTKTSPERECRRGTWAIYSRNRDLNRNGKLDPDEIRWFVPAINQYTLCFLGGRPVFDNPLFEKNKTITMNDYIDNWAWGVPLSHYMSSTNQVVNQIFWAEEGASKGRFGAGKMNNVNGIRMARMLTKHGVISTGEAFKDNLTENKLSQDALFFVSKTPNGIPVEYDQRVNGENYYITFNKMNISAFREFIRVGDINLHTHEMKENWLYRTFKVAKNYIGYRAGANTDSREWAIEGTPQTWWRLNGVITKDTGSQSKPNYKYKGADHSLAYEYKEDPTGNDLHHWRIPNLREAAVISMSFNSNWFGRNGNSTNSIVARTRSENLGPKSTDVPYWDIRCDQVVRWGGSSGATDQYIRAVMDVQ